MARNRVANLSGEILATSINVTSISLTTGLDVATQANNAYDQANSAFSAANNRVLKAGDTMTGELNVANNLIITGNVGIGSSNPSYSLQLGIPDANANNMLVVAGGMGKPIGLTSGALYSEYTGISNGAFLVFLAGQGVKFKDFTDNQEWLNVTSSLITTNANLVATSVNAQSFFTSTGANVSNAVVKTGDTMTGLLNVANNLVVTGNVGIGTSSTSNSIQINAISPSIRLEETDSGGSKRLEFSVANNGVARISADQSSQEIAFSTVGTERIRIGSNGAVLVGTTSDPTGSTTQHFFSHSGNNATAFIVGDAVNSSSISGIYIRSLDPRLVRPTNIPISIADTAGNKHVVIDGTGRVGIGTTSPSVQLFVASAESGYTANLAESVTKSAVLFKTHNSDSTVTSFGAISGGNGFIQRSNGPGTGTYAICLNPFGGNVGIGTTSPAAELDVKHATDPEIHLTIDTHGAAGKFLGDADGLKIFGQGASNQLRFYTSTTERARITSGGSFLVNATSQTYGPTSFGYMLGLVGTSTQTFMSFARSGQTLDDQGLVVGLDSGASYFYARDNIAIVLGTNDIERARITSDGNFLVGVTSGVVRVEITQNNPTRGILQRISNSATSSRTGAQIQLVQDSLADWVIGQPPNENAFAFWTGRNPGADGTERARITSDGNFVVGKTAVGVNAVGCEIRAIGFAGFTRNDGTPLGVNRLASDGDLVHFYQDSVVEGSISVSGATVSYNAFAGSHWSQLQDGSKPDILRGTVMESINELCEWEGEDNERLPKCKISDTAGSKKVYGVFMAWDNDWTETNDMYVTAVGAFICRVNANVTVQEGDLLESNGDGTARVQADDIIRSSTIGKVTSTVKTHQYDDGSYCVPTVLYCG